MKTAEVFLLKHFLLYYDIIVNKIQARQRRCAMYKKTVYVLLAVLMAAAMFAACAKEPAAEVSDESGSPLAEETKKPSDEKRPTKEPEDQATDEPYPGELTNILLMGSMDGDFSDKNIQNYALTHILITLDPKTRSLRLTTFPYNLKIKPVLKDGEDVEYMQLQFLYAQYGANVVTATLSERFGIEIDNWVVMNMHGVKEIVDELGGLEIDLPDIKVNEMAEAVEMILSYVWEEIKEEGKQTLNGIQITGYFMDTYHDLDEENPLKDEEMRFRERHEDIIDALIVAIKAFEMDDQQMVELAKKIKSNFATDIKERDWDDIAKMALACIENRQEYLHVPHKIETEETKSMRSIVYDEVKDVNAVIKFVSGK